MLSNLVWPIRGTHRLSEKLGFNLRNPARSQIPLLSRSLESRAYGTIFHGHNLTAKHIEEEIDEFRSQNLKKLSALRFKGLNLSVWEFLAANWVVIEILEIYEPKNEWEETQVYDVAEAYGAIIDFCRGIYLQSTMRFVASRFYPHPQIYNPLSEIRLDFVPKLLNSGLEANESKYYGEDIHSKILSQNIGMHYDLYVPQIAISEFLALAKSLESSDILVYGYDEIYYLGSNISASLVKSQNWHLTVLTLSSILEFLVARNPDASKFNVEDSINKQFQIKSALLANKFDSSFDLHETAKFLKQVYNIRSKIAHGDFRSLKKELGNKNFDDYDFITKIQRITIACLHVFINDPKFVDFLKNH